MAQADGERRVAAGKGATGVRPQVVVIVLTWNGWTDTIECLASLDALDHRDFAVIVVDNGSEDAPPDRLLEDFPSVELIRTPSNLGFAGGNNVGIRRALERGFDFVWLLNNDTTVAPDTLDRLLEPALADLRVGIVGAVLFSDGTRTRVQVWGGGAVSSVLATVTVATEPQAVDFVCGGSMLVRREVLEQVGLLDDRFFFFMEDADFSRRAADGGWRLAVAPAARVWHKGGASLDAGERRSLRADRLHARAVGVFIGKHAGLLLPVAAPGRLLVIALRRLFRGEAARVPALAVEFVLGVRSGFAGRRA